MSTATVPGAITEQQGAKAIPRYLVSVPVGGGSGRSTGHGCLALRFMVWGCCRPVERHAPAVDRDTVRRRGEVSL